MARSVLSPLGTLLAEMREVQMLSRAPAAVEGRAATAAARPAPEPELHIETRVVTSRSRSGKVRWLWAASLLLHGALILGLIVVPLMLSEALPAPATAARAFFVGPPSVVAPPAPPAPAPAAPATARRSAPTPKAPAPAAAAILTAPADVPEPVAAETAEPSPVADTAAGAEAGGVEGGVPGGIVGGVVGGVVPPPPAPVVPVRVGGEIREPRKLRHVNPVYPEVAVAAKVRGSVVLECLVDPQGRVKDVTLVRGVPILNESAVAAVRQWLYTPTLKDGVPVSVIMTVTVRFDL